MGTLSNEQRDFLRQHRIALSDVFDATGLRAKDWKFLAKESGQGFAFGTTPCGASRHTLRTRAGHCIQCSPSNIAYYKRYRLDGFVYIAGSRETKQIKIGMTRDLSEREKHLNMYRYGGGGDWEVLAWAKTSRAGEHEFEVHQVLQPFASRATYMKAGRTYDCYEVFNCNFVKAAETLQKILPAGVSLKIPSKERAVKHY